MNKQTGANEDQEPQSWAIRLSERARSDIVAAWRYQADVAGEEMGDAWQEGLEREVAKLAQMPESNPKAAESNRFSEVTRQFLYRRTKNSSAYRILFILKQPLDDSPQVFIIHVRHGSQKPITQQEAWAIESSE